jgi:hypothetical protein
VIRGLEVALAVVAGGALPPAIRGGGNELAPRRAGAVGRARGRPVGTRRARLDFSFAPSRPNGAIGARTEFGGQVFRPNGRQLPGGTRIDAYVGSTRCGVASVRRTGSFTGFSLNVVGPEAISGCTRGGTITFRVKGHRALDTAVNEPGTAGPLDLTAP